MTSSWKSITLTEIKDPNFEINEENGKVNAVPESISNKNPNQFMKDSDEIINNSVGNVRGVLFNDSKFRKSAHEIVSFEYENIYCLILNHFSSNNLTMMLTIYLLSQKMKKGLI